MWFLSERCNWRGRIAPDKPASGGVGKFAIDSPRLARLSHTIAVSTAASGFVYRGAVSGQNNSASIIITL